MLGAFLKDKMLAKVDCILRLITRDLSNGAYDAQHHLHNAQASFNVCVYKRGGPQK